MATSCAGRGGYTRSLTHRHYPDCLHITENTVYFSIKNSEAVRFYEKSFGARLKALFGIHDFNEQFFEELEDMLIEEISAPRLPCKSLLKFEACKSERPTSQKDLQLLMEKNP